MTNPEFAIRHATAAIDSTLRMHYAVAGSGPKTLVLLHGFPQTGLTWHEVMPIIAAKGWRVVAPDYRGAGGSSKPQSGYDKSTMARDIRILLRDHLRIDGPVAMGGHDLGAMVAFAFAANFREDTSHLILFDAIIPGTAVFDTVCASPRVWHFSFHGVPDLPEFLVRGREREYLRLLVESRLCDPSKFTPAKMDDYARAYEAVGAMRAAFDIYRAFPRDRDENRANIATQGKLTIPVQVVSGTESPLSPLMEPMMNEFAERVEAIHIAGSSHWLSEERPQELAHAVLDFLDR